MAAPKGNKNAVGNQGGRPALYPTPESLQKKIDSYFNGGAEEKSFIVGSGKSSQLVKLPVYTITGLCFYLNFCSRQTFYEYGERIEFKDIIKKAKLRIEKVYEENLQFGNTVGAIFALKNMDWHDKQEHEHSGQINDFSQYTSKQLAEMAKNIKIIESQKK